VIASSRFERITSDGYLKNVAQRGDALDLLRSLLAECASRVSFDDEVAGFRDGGDHGEPPTEPGLTSGSNIRFGPNSRSRFLAVPPSRGSRGDMFHDIQASIDNTAGCSHYVLMVVETLSDALSTGWRVHARCLGGVVDNTRSTPREECAAEG
jgi:hypothetical protein